MKKFTKALLALAVSVACSTVANSAFYINANVATTSDADIKKSTSQLKTTNYGVSVSNGTFTLNLEQTKYDFSGGYEPVDQVNKIAFDYNKRFDIFSNMALYTGVTVGALYEDSISISESYKIAPRAALGWNFTNSMTGYLGVAAVLNDADNDFLPIIGLEIGRNHELGWTGAIGYPATFIQYRFSPSLAVQGRFETVRDLYHLDDDLNKGEARDGYFKEKSYGLSAGVVFTPMQHINLSAGVMSYFDREFELYNKNGKKFDSFETDASYGAYVKVGLVF